ncbi:MULTISPECIES: pyruvate, water dikinase regulatory protein [Priestia]|jgi:regulator of PEP synthase PpsR (kinase-PPPase family)|uniref:Putative pyruvate, phosphate dikinase regulatory protein n=5 Tax=Priestia TaxID=2800373 RepID=D5DSF1_PRIM1|nr:MULTISPECIES: pyruvate, water dikinase regulatory protein [Priestia]AVX10426.1 kinase/pyrophosphorylase [Bacillus sp. Y-01]KOP76509.1 phosphotransferase [Bacillus sp. FJAT-21351]KQU14553.1 phosphoenolpyruvate synthetase regulatory protein [Bacillus sp. Leaf75]KRD89370.1 phosphoenolpyruvate synthetase regulatory protein [Bacillus sp. Root147]KRD92476.1 phosphoenolpyruvate synthetase regulatory protein [Bacillus sp. Root239]KRF57812.1 phosphoenolpyruvate synthetase regulatory protein [Bacill
MNNPCLYVISDSVGETAELVVKAASSQFNMTDFVIKRVPYVEDIATLSEVVSVAKMNNAIIGFTLVKPEMREFLIQEASKNGVEVFDIIGPLIDKIQSSYQLSPRYEPGMARKLDEDYFKKVEAIEFAVKYDDGRDPRGILRADIVLIGVSRTSKTPLSQFLAHKRLKVANVPIVPEVDPPEELFHVSPEKCIGLTISPEKLNDIRKERLKSLGLNDKAIYANIGRIKEELEFFQGIVDKIGCEVVDVSNRAVEETAGIILNTIKKK